MVEVIDRSPNWFESRAHGYRVTIMRYSGRCSVTEDRSGTRPYLCKFEVPVQGTDFEMLCAAELKLRLTIPQLEAAE